jgi:hypothetical protein
VRVYPVHHFALKIQNKNIFNFQTKTFLTYHKALIREF